MDSLLLKRSQGIFRYDLSDQTTSLVVPLENSVENYGETGLAIDTKNEFLYWVDGGSIWRSDLSGADAVEHITNVGRVGSLVAVSVPEPHFDTFATFLLLLVVGLHRSRGPTSLTC